MTDFPQSPVPPRFLHSLSSYAGADILRIAGTSAAAASGNWPSANLAIYIPFWLPWPYSVRRVFWANGATLTGNKDFGIYSAEGTRIYSTGSTAESGASAIQYTTPSPDILLSPGRYYFALSCSATTGHGWQVSTGAAAEARHGGLLQQATAVPLPATMTPASFTGTVMPLCGITSTTTGF